MWRKCWLMCITNEIQYIHNYGLAYAWATSCKAASHRGWPSCWFETGALIAGVLVACVASNSVCADFCDVTSQAALEVMIYSSSRVGERRRKGWTWMASCIWAVFSMISSGSVECDTTGHVWSVWSRSWYICWMSVVVQPCCVQLCWTFTVQRIS